MAEVGLWRGVKGLTPIALSWKKDTYFTEASVVNFPVCFSCVVRSFNFFGDTIFKRRVFTVLCVLQAVQSLEISF